MKHRIRTHKLLITVIILLGATIVSPFFIHEAPAQSTFQKWNLIVTTNSGDTYSGTLNVLSDGDFTSSGFTGSTSQGTYEISITGWMSGTSVSFTETASYDGGNGYIYGEGDGELNTAFPYATSAYGTVSGTISDPLGNRPFNLDWTATKTSGGSGGTGDDDGTGSLDSFLGSDMFPFIVLVGLVAIIGGTIGAVKLAANSKRAKQNVQGATDTITKNGPPQMRYSRPTNPQYGPPSPPNSQTPTGIQGSLTPQPITMDHGVPITGTGASVAPIEIGTLPFLNGNWEPGRVTLSWAEPQYDPSKYILRGYRISQQTYGPTSTAPQTVQLGPLLPKGTNQVPINYTQTYRYSTGGDIAGFRVDPYFEPVNQPGGGFSSGGLGLRVGEPFGTFGVGP